MSQNRSSPADTESEGGHQDQFLTFLMDDEYFAFGLRSVREIIRVPPAVAVPLAPSSLVGLANLRGAVLPVVDLRRLLSLPPTTYTDATRVVVADVGRPLGLVVDRVAHVLSVDAERVESADTVQATVRTDLLTGVIKDVGDAGVVQLLDVDRCVQLEFAAVAGEVAAVVAATTTRRSVDAGHETEGDGSQLVSFMVAEQEYALAITEVEEIVRVPEHVSRVPQADARVLGLISLRGRLLPLVSMRRMLGLSDAERHADTERVVVVGMRTASGRQESLGVVVDQVREVLRVDSALRDPVPALLAGRRGDDLIDSVCRLEDGNRLVSVLSARSLLDTEAVSAALESAQEEAKDMAIGATNLPGDEDQLDDETQVVVCQISGQEYGVLVESVQEIIRVPEQMSRVPKTRSYIEGLINLRGRVLPVMDLRQRFGLERSKRTDRQRIMVLNHKGTCTGFVVDSVTEVLRLPRSTIERSPTLSDDQARIMGHVANLHVNKRMVQLLDATELIEDEELETMVNHAEAV